MMLHLRSGARKRSLVGGGLILSEPLTSESSMRKLSHVFALKSGPRRRMQTNCTMPCFGWAF